jgi:phage baseplate assembly protein W
MDRVIFSDLNSDVKNREALRLNGEAILYSVYNLITTEIGQRLNLCAYGVNLYDQLFEQIDDTTSWQLITELMFAIRSWEPRVDVDTANSWAKPNYDENAYELQLMLIVKNFPGMSFSISGLYRKLLKQ